ncbi:hypothetical protein DP190_22775 [Enterobacter cloacae]|nr:hypothetical protein DP190_22775 [Enterobacter cloacae]
MNKSRIVGALTLIIGLSFSTLTLASPIRQLLTQFNTPLYAGHILRVGYIAPDFPPYDITIDNRYYDGINADILTQIARSEQVQVTVEAFGSLREAKKALQDKRIDLITTQKITNQDKTLQQLPYLLIDDDIILEKSFGNKTDSVAIALTEGLNNYEEVKKIYPDAKVTVYKTSLSAMASLEFGKNTLFIGDAASVGYFSANSLFSNINVIGFLGGQEKLQNLAFTLRAEDESTANLLRSGIKKIQPVTMMQILRKWDKSKDFIIPGGASALSERTTEWLKTHPTIQVWLEPDNLPWSAKVSGSFKGITVDILQQIANKLSLRIEFTDNKVDADVIGVNRRRREDARLTTRAYLLTPFVIVKANNLQLKSKKIQRIGILRDNSTRSFQRIQGAKLSLFNNIYHAYEALQAGDVDAVIDSYPSAKYFIRKYGWQFTLSDIASDISLNAAFSVSATNPALYEVLNEGIISLSPSQIYAIFRKWDTPQVEESYFSRYRTELLGLIIVLISVSLISLLWMFKLRKQVAISLSIGQQLDNQLLLTQALINGTPHPLYIRDTETRLISCNQAYLNALSVGSAEVINTPVDAGELRDKFSTDEYIIDFYRILEHREQLIIKERTLRHIDDNSEQRIYHWMVPYTDHKGEIRGVLGGWIDITFRKAIEQELQMAKNSADAANREKTRFLAFITHEIRTQLNAIMGMLEIGNKKIQEGIIDAQAFDVALSSSKSLQEIIGNVLDITQIESGKLSLHLEHVNIVEVSRQIVEKYRPLSLSKGLALRFIGPSDPKPPSVLIDRLRYNQILSNLVNNAIKFTHQGTISVEVTTTQINQGREVSASVVVRDSGCGIREEDQPKLFELYAQLSRDNKQSGASSGLGLHFCKILMEMMNGSIKLDSVYNEGTVVTLEFTTPACSEAIEKVVTSLDELKTNNRNLRVFIVDDFYPNIIVLSKQLDYLGYTVISCSTPKEALRQWQEARANIVLTDCNMPDVSGFDLTRAIRKHDPNCIIIGLTADAREEQYQLCLQAGMNDCLFKPLSLTTLSTALSKFSTNDTSPDIADPVFISNLRNDSTFMNAFIEQVNQDLSDLFDALHAQNFEEVLELAHKLKGGFNVIALHDLARLCEQLEVAAHRQDALSCIQHINSLEEKIIAL